MRLFGKDSRLIRADRKMTEYADQLIATGCAAEAARKAGDKEHQADLDARVNRINDQMVALDRLMLEYRFGVDVFFPWEGHW